MTPPDEITRTVATDGFLLSRELFMQPAEIGRAPIDDRQRHDLRHLVAVELRDPLLQALEQVAAAFDDEKDFFAALNAPFPAICRLDGVHPVNTGGEPLLHQSFGDAGAFVR